MRSLFISLLEADKRAQSLTTLDKIAAYLKKDLRIFPHTLPTSIIPFTDSRFEFPYLLIVET
jgi:hypothetical protein